MPLKLLDIAGHRFREVDADECPEARWRYLATPLLASSLADFRMPDGELEAGALLVLSRLVGARQSGAFLGGFLAREGEVWTPAGAQRIADTLDRLRTLEGPAALTGRAQAFGTLAYAVFQVSRIHWAEIRQLLQDLQSDDAPRPESPG